MISPKIKAYMGFAIKSGEVLIGIDNLKKKKLYLILYSSGLSDNAKEKCFNIAYQNKILAKEILDDDMIELMNGGVKVLGISSKSLAEAIINNF